MDDIIVLILTVIFIIAGVFGQMKKRQTEANAEPEPDSAAKRPDSGNFWDHLQDEWEEPGQEEKAEPVLQKQPRFRNIEQNYLFKAEDEGKRIFTRNTTISKPIQVDKRTSRRKKFPLKKAVIYSEILHRKYE
jgi:hypothetical protein